MRSVLTRIIACHCVKVQEPAGPIDQQRTLDARRGHENHRSTGEHLQQGFYKKGSMVCKSARGSFESSSNRGLVENCNGLFRNIEYRREIHMMAGDFLCRSSLLAALFFRPMHFLKTHVLSTDLRAMHINQTPLIKRHVGEPILWPRRA